MKATFEIQWQKKGVPKHRQRPAQLLEVDALLVGSGASTDVWIRDRLVAARALWLRPALGGLSIEPIESFAGAFLNGLPVRGHEVLGVGDALQLGQALIEVKAAAEGRYTVAVEEGYLHHAVHRLSEKSAGLEVKGPQEALWLRQPVFARAVKASLLAGLLVLVVFPLFRNTELLSGGPLTWAHATAPNGPDECADCHRPGRASGSDFDAACLACHAGYGDSPLHPYASAEQADARHCTRCHLEHEGTDRPFWQPIEIDLAALLTARRNRLSGQADGAARAGDASNTVAPFDRSAVACRSCHEDRLPLPAPAAAGSLLSRDRDRRENVSLAFESFSHAAHAGTSARFAGRAEGMQCVACHELATERRHDGETEFRRIEYTDCTGCHKTRMEPEQHGHGSNTCLGCHRVAEGPERGERRKVALPDATTLYSFAPKSHAVADVQCSQCHRRTATGEQRRIRGRRFTHASHLPTLPDGAIDAAAAAAACASCHGGVSGSDSLVELFSAAPGARDPEPPLPAGLVVDLSGCSRCHEGAAEVERTTAGERTVNDMIHRLHVAPSGREPATLELGCLSCHEPSPRKDASAGEAIPQEPGVAARDMALRAGASDCTACHARHERISCATCHVDRDQTRSMSGGRPCERGVTDPDWRIDVVRTGVLKFRHTSPGHDGLDCMTCHDDVDGARRRGAVLERMPSVANPICVDCHLRTRYHR